MTGFDIAASDSGLGALAAQRPRCDRITIGTSAQRSGKSLAPEPSEDELAAHRIWSSEILVVLTVPRNTHLCYDLQSLLTRNSIPIRKIVDDLTIWPAQ